MRKFDSNISSLFGNNPSASLFSDFAAKKTGSYKRLIKTYYADQKNKALEEKNAKDKYSRVDDKKDFLTAKPRLSQVKKEADSLKKAAGELSDADLWKTTDGKVDMDKVKGALKNFTSEYNDVLSQTSKANSKDVTMTTRYMTNLTNAMSKSLSKIGVNVAKDGKLSIDEDALMNADAKDVKALFSGENSYAGQVGERAREISRDAVMDTGLYSATGGMPNSLASMFNTWI